MKVFGTFLATFALSLTFAFAQTATTTATTTDKKACTAGEKAACCAGKNEKAACCKGDKAHADAASDAKPVAVVEETTTVRTPGGNGRRVIHKSNKKASMKPQASKE